jgi:hypothetical protein
MKYDQEYYVAGYGELWGSGSTPKEAVEEAISEIDRREEEIQISRRPRERKNGQELVVARRGEGVTEKMLKQGEWEIRGNDEGDETGYKIH